MRLSWTLAAPLLAVPDAKPAVIGGPLLRDGRYPVPTALAGTGGYHLTYIVSPTFTYPLQNDERAP